MFDKIIATDVASSGGIGCDNMTCSIIQFKHQWYSLDIGWINDLILLKNITNLFY